MKAIEVYAGSDGDLTKRYYEELQKRGAIGLIAVNLFRACKNSQRAKVYRGGIRGKGSYKSMAYDRKNWALSVLSGSLAERGAELGITFGWKEDPGQAYHSWVLYVDLKGVGQVSFHSGQRFDGPDYPGEWCGDHRSAERIIEFCDRVYSGKHSEAVV